MLNLLAETGFDRGKSPEGFLFVVVVGGMMLVFIFLGGLYMRSQEIQARRAAAERAQAASDDPGDSLSQK